MPHETEPSDDSPEQPYRRRPHPPRNERGRTLADLAALTDPAFRQRQNAGSHYGSTKPGMGEEPPVEPPAPPLPPDSGQPPAEPEDTPPQP